MSGIIREEDKTTTIIFVITSLIKIAKYTFEDPVNV